MAVNFLPDRVFPILMHKLQERLTEKHFSEMINRLNKLEKRKIKERILLLAEVKLGFLHFLTQHLE